MRIERWMVAGSVVVSCALGACSSGSGGGGSSSGDTTSDSGKPVADADHASTDTGTKPPTTTSDSGAGVAETSPLDDGGSTLDDGGIVDETGETSVGDVAPSSAPATPTITAVAPMSGSLHVTWTLNDTGLTKVELSRKEDDGDYAVVFTLGGDATSQHDMDANDSSVSYCYQVVTYRGDVPSAPSAEQCASP